MKKTLLIILIVAMILSVTPFGAFSSYAMAESVELLDDTNEKPTNKWVLDENGVWHYYDVNGELLKGLQLIDNVYYFFDENGNMQTGWRLIDEIWYYFAENGAMQTGWKYIGNSWYYMNGDGQMQTGWLEWNGQRYYLNLSGAMQTGWKTIDDVKYLFNSSGVCIEGANSFIIDISKWQGNIDWDKLAQTDIDGVVLRISYGGTTTENNGDSKDTKFDEYIENLERLQIPYGVYHFNTATTVEKAQIQAQNVIGILKESGANPTLPIFVDIETNGGECDLNEIAKVYVSKFITSGYKPGIYANENYWNEYLGAPELKAYYRWIANYGKNDGLPSASFSPKDGIENYMMWQYTSVGEIDGIDENTVDLNVLYDWYLKPDGWSEIAGKKYHYNNGLLTYGLLTEGDNLYCMNSLGEMAVGWVKVDDTWYYTNSNGIVQTEWQYIGNAWYYLGSNGAMQTGWQYVGNAWYYMNSGGAMQTGWQRVGNSWYYMNSSGVMQTGWQRVGNSWYYLNLGGAMQTGWQYIDNAWYYMNLGGVMQTGWLQLGNTWYYLNLGGAMQTGWQLINNTWYYFYDSGAMATNIYISGGYINSSGAWSA